jgi:hypothetical protein
MVRVSRFLAAALLGLAPCGALADTSFNPLDWFNQHPQPTKDSEKLIKLPTAPEDLDCPNIDVFEGGATSRVGGPANSDVRYQFDIADIARECDPQGNQFALKIGVAGRLLIGPAGSPGNYSTSLRVQVKRDIDNKVLYDKSVRVAADTAGADRTSFRMVLDPIVLPLTRARLDLDYSVYVGLGGGGAAPAKAGHHRRHRR